MRRFVRVQKIMMVSVSYSNTEAERDLSWNMRSELQEDGSFFQEDR